MKRILSLSIALIMMFTCVFALPETASAAGLKVAPVTKVSASLYASNQVNVSWTKKSSATGYIVYAKLGNKWKQLKTIRSKNITSTRRTGVSKGRSLTYGVRAYIKKNGKTYYSPRKVASVYVPKVMTRRTKGFSKTTAGKLISTAKKKVGSRYVSGGSGPSKFDCSGFVYYVANKSKASTKKVKRTTAASMWKNLKKYSIKSTSLSKAQPGDIVFTASMGGSSITHTGFYYGDGKMVHATNPRRGVVIDQAKYYGKIKGIVRLPNL